MQSFLYDDPVTLHEQKISDHSPVIVSLAAKRQLRSDERPIPPYVFESPLYKKVLDALVNASGLQMLSVPLRLRKFKQLIREAARIARNDVLLKVQHRHESRATLYLSIARCVWRNDRQLFETLCVSSADAVRHLARDGDTISIKDEGAFDVEFNEARRSAVAGRLRQLVSKSRVAALRRMMKLWDPFGKKVSIAGIRLSNGVVVDKPDEMLSALASTCGQVFSQKPIDLHKATEFAEHYTSHFDFSSAPPPSSRRFSRFLRRVSHSSAGVDGTPLRGVREIAGHFGSNSL